MKQNGSEIPMYCPVCTRGKVFVAANQEEAERIRLLKPEEASGASGFTKCRVCGSQVGVKFKGQDSKSYLIPLLGIARA